MRRGNFLYSRAKLQRERVDLIRRERRDQFSLDRFGQTYRHLLAIYLTCADNRRSKREMYIWRRFAVQFHEPHNDFVALLGFLEGQHPHAAVADFQQGLLFPQRALMFCTFKCNQRLIEAICLPVGLRQTPVSCMARQPIDKFVVAPVLRQLVTVGFAVSCTKAGRINEGEPQSTIIWFV